MTATLPDARVVVEGMRHRKGSILFRFEGEVVRRPFADVFDEAAALARSLVNRGVSKGDIIGIHGETSYGWLLLDLACVLSGAISLAIYPSAPIDRACASAKEGGAKIVFSDNLAAQRKFAEVGLGGLSLSTADDEEKAESNVGALVREGLSSKIGISESGPVAFTAVSTSGTLSEPKLFGVRCEPLVFTMREFARIYDFRAERVMMALPLAHLPQRMMLYGCLDLGFDLVLSSPRDFVKDSNTFEPTVHVTVPRLLEHLWQSVIGRSAQGNRDYRSAFGRGAKCIFVGSAPTRPALMREFLDAGAPVWEVYGTTELGMIGLNMPGAREPGTVGRPVPWADVKLDPSNSEITVRTPHPFLYGLLVGGKVVPVPRDAHVYEATGDVGEMKSGLLRVLGRTKDFIALESGEKIFVKPIEDEMAQATGAQLCVVTGSGRKHPDALLFFDASTVAKWNDEELERRCLVEVRAVNARLHPWERVKTVAVLRQMPTASEGTLTDTLKPRRHKITERYADTRRLNVGASS